MLDYHDRVRTAIRERTGKPILNGNLDHAAIIVQEAFSNAQASIRLLSSRLDPACYAQRGVVEAAKVFLADKDHKAEILLESEMWDPKNNFQWGKHPMLAELRDFWDRIEIRLVPKDWTERYGFNFMLLDDYGFRYEADRRQPAAVAAFLPSDGPKKQVENLKAIFSELWNVSKEFKLN
jgi:hypothetical protein